MAIDTIIILYALAGMLFMQIAMQAADGEMRQRMGQYAGIFMILATLIVLSWPLWMTVDIARFVKEKLER